MKSKYILPILVAAMAVAVAAVCWINGLRNPVVRPVSAEDERIAAEAVLAAKLSGPRYFNPQVADPAADGERWIWIDDALSQVPRLMAERKLGPDAGAAIRQLIAQLAEPHPYRTVGGQRINLMRLNLSLDTIK